jgi:hypothetical protein
MKIYGAGLAGLLAATMLRRYRPVIHEAQPSLPHNHEALLRFRTDDVSRVTGIPFRKVRVLKGICDQDGIVHTTPNLRFSNQYALKVTGEIIDRSIMNLDPAERFIAPPNLIAQLAEGLRIEYNSSMSWHWQGNETEPTISTIPMPALMSMAGWDAPKFNFRTITTITADIISPPIEVYQTLYYPGEEAWYRCSITGNHLIIEIMGAHDNDVHYIQNALRNVTSDFGMSQYNEIEFDNVDLKTQSYGKIAPIDNNIRQQFILAMSDRYGIYSVGRYATWRNILLDDVVNDVRQVEKFITQRNSYVKKLAHNN